ncbi:MAG: hypothetical protein ACXQS8_08655, partial [Candidatus Helarchaeales archaeon]
MKWTKVRIFIVLQVLVLMVSIPLILNSPSSILRNQESLTIPENLQATNGTFGDYFQLFHPAEINGETDITNCDVEFPPAYQVRLTGLEGNNASITMNITFDVSSLSIPESDLNLLFLNFEVKSLTTYFDDINFSKLIVKIYNESFGGYFLVFNKTWNHSTILRVLGDDLINVTSNIQDYIINGQVKFQIILNQVLLTSHSNYDLTLYLYYCSLILGQNIEFVLYEAMSAEIVEFNSRYNLGGSINNLREEDNQSLYLEIYPTLQGTLEIAELDLRFNVNGCQYDRIYGILLDLDHFFDILETSGCYYSLKVYIKDVTTGEFHYVQNWRKDCVEKTENVMFVDGDQWVDQDGFVTLRYHLELEDNDGSNRAYLFIDKSLIHVIRRSLPLVNVEVPSEGYVKENIIINITSLPINGIYFHPLSSIVFDYGSWQESHNVTDGITQFNMCRDTAGFIDFDLIIYYDSNESNFVQGHYTIEVKRIDVIIEMDDPIALPFSISGSIRLLRKNTMNPLVNKSFNFMIFHGYNQSPSYFLTPTTNETGQFDFYYQIDEEMYLDEYYRITVEIEQDEIYNYQVETKGVICDKAPANITLNSLTPLINDGYAGDTIEI